MTNATSVGVKSMSIVLGTAIFLKGFSARGSAAEEFPSGPTRYLVEFKLSQLECAIANFNALSETSREHQPKLTVKALSSFGPRPIPKCSQCWPHWRRHRSQGFGALGA
jgi:hypothetical protein